MLKEQAADMGMYDVWNEREQIVELDNFNKALFALMDDRYKGGMEIQSQSFNGLISNDTDRAIIHYRFSAAIR
ncbi:hypothetical protein CWS01_15905 [Niallia nealsonii]|uniref:Uncharacterized protein n=1 Tax=Niallia nealsonii TaxID=115979 RepID=A0A2N0YZE6_9BACI|nr:hypothetical protein CWS01_15905 [Niallia nealsonii]